MAKKSNKKLLLGLIATVEVCLIIFIAFFLYAGTFYPAEQSAKDILQTKFESFEIQQVEGNYYFIPTYAKAGFIFYPGGKVEATAYLPLMSKLAQNGIVCVLLQVPFNLAIFKTNAADGIIQKVSTEMSWYIGGHSLGGATAAMYVDKHSESYAGLILLAAYSTKDLNNKNVDVLSIYGSCDGVLNQKKYNECKNNLPKNTIEYIIQGGNHASYACYGKQKGDGVATISNEQQQNLTATAITNWIFNRKID